MNTVRGMESRTIDLDGPVHLVDHGGTGRPILLVHGIGGSHANFTAVADAMTDLGHVHAVDLVGYGHTPPAGRTSDLRTNRDMLVDLLDEAFDEPVVLLGTSLGGLLGLLVAGAAPARVHRLVLVGPGQPYPRGVPIDWPSALSFVALMLPVIGPWLARREVDGDPAAIVDHNLSLMCAHPDRVPDAARDAMIAVARERQDMPWAAETFRQTVRSLIRELRRTHGFDEFVARLQPPTLLVHGEQDALVVPEASRRLARLRPDWRFEMLPDIGHSPQLEAPDLLCDLLGDWLGDGAGADDAHRPNRATG